MEQPSQQAQCAATYTIDMFASIPEGSIVTFAKAGNGMANVTYPNGSIEIAQAIFDKHFIYYKQSKLF
jgi:hypothetical protein